MGLLTVHLTTLVVTALVVPSFAQTESHFEPRADGSEPPHFFEYRPSYGPMRPPYHGDSRCPGLLSVDRYRSVRQCYTDIPENENAVIETCHDLVQVEMLKSDSFPPVPEKECLGLYIFYECLISRMNFTDAGMLDESAVANSYELWRDMENTENITWMSTAFEECFNKSSPNQFSSNVQHFMEIMYCLENSCKEAQPTHGGDFNLGLDCMLNALLKAVGTSSETYGDDEGKGFVNDPFYQFNQIMSKIIRTIEEECGPNNPLMSLLYSVHPNRHRGKREAKLSLYYDAEEDFTHDRVRRQGSIDSSPESNESDVSNESSDTSASASSDED